ncbi:MAG: endo-1,4-beta-xylanase [Defluviitaleaceae bacterium]|nr:endo-1,4-beta-xylanase [Defluviitaleaceae bacterium]
MDNKFSHRKGTAIVKIADVAGKNVKIRQLRHSFLFGCSEFSTLPYAAGEMDEKEHGEAAKRYSYMTELFNSVTLPFYWGRYEPTQGKPDTERMMAAAKMLKSMGVTLKGHPLCWHTVCADWLMDIDNGKIYQTQIARIQREVSGFAGCIDMWDVINEAVVMPRYSRYDNAMTRICSERGRISLIKDLFAAAKEANPNATLLINDYDTSVAYDILIEGLLAAGVKIDAIGIQSHMHQRHWSAEKTEEILARHGRFGLPLHFTEVSMLSGELMAEHYPDLNDFSPDEWPSTPAGEARQAEEVVTFYETLYAHPLVQSITWWNFHDGLWLNAPSGLLSRQSDPKPAYVALHSRIKGDWWTPEQHLVTNEQGCVVVNGTKGDYVAVCDGREIGFAIG